MVEATKNGKFEPSNIWFQSVENQILVLVWMVLNFVRRFQLGEGTNLMMCHTPKKVYHFSNIKEIVRFETLNTPCFFAWRINQNSNRIVKDIKNGLLS